MATRRRLGCGRALVMNDRGVGEREEAVRRRMLRELQNMHWLAAMAGCCWRTTDLSGVPGW